MRILVINYYHTPAGGAHAFRWSALSNHYAKQGHEVCVITSRVRGAPRIEKNNNLTIVRGGLVRLEQTLQTDWQQSVNLKSQIFKFFKKPFRPIYRMLYWPDALWHWMPFLFKKIYDLRSEKYDLVISYYPSFSSHIGGFFYKVFIGKKSTTWILDYGDPFSVSYDWQPNNYKIYSFLNKFVERSFFKYGIPVFTNNQTKEEYKNEIGDFGAQVIPNMVDMKLFYQPPNHQNMETVTTVKLTYLGAFYRDVREPFKLLQLVDSLNKLSNIKFVLEIYGPDHGFNLSGPDYPFINFHGPVTREQALDIMQHSQILVNVENRDCLMTPSKVVECIATGLPILNILNGEPRHEPKDKYRQIGFLINAHGNETGETLQKVFDNLVRLAKTRKARPKQVQNALAGNYLLEDCAEAYLQLLNV